MAAEDAFEFMGYDDFDPDEFEHRTVGAWVLENFEYMPQKGDSFTWGPMKVTITEAAPNRIVKVIIVYAKEETPDA